MKVGPPRAFWSLRPATAARSLEWNCWLAAAILALALALLPAPNTGAAAQVISASAATPAPHLSIYQQHCMERILARSAARTEEDVARLIDQLCFAPFRGAAPRQAGLAVPSCDRLFSVWLTPPAKPVAGCVGG
jgi:hypothetical protein